MSYDDTLPTDKDKARFLLGDTSNDATTELLSDSTVTSAITNYGYTSGVAFLASGLATRFAQQPGSVSVGGKSVSWPDRVRRWVELAAQMRAGGVTGAAVVAPYVGGISKTDKQADEEDTDRVAPAFTRTLMSDPADPCIVPPG